MSHRKSRRVFASEGADQASPRYPERIWVRNSSSIDFSKFLLAENTKISMDGRRAWDDNVFAERLWKSVKQEVVYLRAYETVSHAQASIGRYLELYNGRRPHSSLGRRTPEQAYFEQPLFAA